MSGVLQGLQKELGRLPAHSGAVYLRGPNSSGNGG